MMWILVGAALAAAGVPGGLMLYRQASYGERYGGNEHDIRVTPDALFTVVVPDRGPSVGDMWTAFITDVAVVSQEYSTLVADDLFEGWLGLAPRGGGGHRLITFRARTPGKTTITVRNCYQGCDTKRTRAESRSVTWTVRVSR